MTDQTASGAFAPDELDGLAAAGAEHDAKNAPPGAPIEGELLDPQAEQHMPTHEIFEMLLNPLFAIMAPNWDVKTDEVKGLSMAYGALLDKYLPGGLDFGEELGALVITLAVFGPRLSKPRKAPEPQAAEPGVTHVEPQAA